MAAQNDQAPGKASATKKTAARKPAARKTAAAKPRSTTSSAALQTEIARWRTAVGGAMTAIMMVDRDLVVTYVNDATRELLSRHGDALASVIIS